MKYDAEMCQVLSSFPFLLLSSFSSLPLSSFLPLSLPFYFVFPFSSFLSFSFLLAILFSLSLLFSLLFFLLFSPLLSFPLFSHMLISCRDISWNQVLHARAAARIGRAPHTRRDGVRNRSRRCRIDPARRRVGFGRGSRLGSVFHRCVCGSLFYFFSFLFFISFFHFHFSLFHFFFFSPFPSSTLSERPLFLFLFYLLVTYVITNVTSFFASPLPPRSPFPSLYSPTLPSSLSPTFYCVPHRGSHHQWENPTQITLFLESPARHASAHHELYSQPANPRHPKFAPEVALRADERVQF